jgi:hypothetical protein
MVTCRPGTVLPAATFPAMHTCTGPASVTAKMTCTASAASRYITCAKHMGRLASPRPSGGNRSIPATPRVVYTQRRRRATISYGPVKTTKAWYWPWRT